MGPQEESNNPSFWVRILCKQGQLAQAVDLLCGMHPPPSSRVCLFLLKACNHQRSLFEIRRIHAHVARYPILLTGSLADYLVMTLARCGALDDALHLFLALPSRTVYSWTAIMSAYTECGQGEDIRKLYLSMLDDCVEPDAYTFVCLFKACGCTRDLGLGKELHSEARKKGLTGDVYVGNTLMSMYGKCSALKEAEDVFKGLDSRNLVSHCVMLSTYVAQGEGGKALLFYRQMLDENINPDRLASMLALQACALLADNEASEAKEGESNSLSLLQIGQAIHADALRKGFTSDIYFNSALISMYGKVGSIMEAEQAFQVLSMRNIVTWNAMISACVDQGMGDEALWLYCCMQKERVCPDQLTLVFTFQACGIYKELIYLDIQSNSKACLEIGRALHMDACKRGVTMDAVLGSALLTMYGKCKALPEVDDTFLSLLERNIVVWNSVLTIYVEQGYNDKVLLLYRQLQEENIIPDELSFATCLQACAALVEKDAPNSMAQSDEHAGIFIGRSLHSDAWPRGSLVGLSLGNALLKFYTKCGLLSEAEQVFEVLSAPNLVSWNVILKAYVDNNQAERALQFFSHMEKQSVSYDQVTILYVMQACSITASIEVCKCMHFLITSTELEQVPLLATTTIHAYGCFASMADAQALLDGLPDPHVAPWNACISGHTGEGNHMLSFYFFEMLKLIGLMPNEVTFTSILSACSHSGLLIEALELFKSIDVDFGLLVDTKHMAIMVDLLGRLGNFARIYDMFGWIKAQADLSTFLCLLGACRVHGNLNLADQVFDAAVQFYPEEAPLYVLISNIHADAGHCNSIIQYRQHIPQQADELEYK
ncbi:hypothetical protein KP509_17G075500 [Ceratopteris richardii]|nr:hypothetical protein KP509_17G075500 [Ceratopteris richardii]